MLFPKNKNKNAISSESIKISVPETMLAAEAYEYAKKFLELAEAKILICYLTDLSPTNLILHGNDENYRLEKSQTKFLEKTIQRRINKEPLAYILGETEFFGFKFKVDKSVLIPRQETEDLLNICCQNIQNRIDEYHLQQQDIKILELGTGSGILSICLRQTFPKIIIHSTDISDKAIKIAKFNEISVREQNQQNFVENENYEDYQAIEFFCGKWFKPIVDSSPLKHFYYEYLYMNPRKLIAKMLEQEDSNNKFSRYDLILSNPPYIAENSEFLQNLTYEPKIALVAEENGIAAIKHIIENAPCFLKPNGWLIFEHGYDQGKISQVILAKNGFENIFTHNDLNGLPRVSGGKMPTI